MIIIRGSIVHSKGPDDLEILLDHEIGVNDAGKIEFLREASAGAANSAASSGKESRTDELIELSPTQFLFPGFVDTHIHAPQYPNAGIFGNSTLLDWLERYTFPMEGKFQDLEIADSVYPKVVSRSLENGTTTASYFGSIHVPATIHLAQTCLKLGQRALIGRVCMERFSPEYVQDGSLASDIAAADGVTALDPQHDLVKPVVTPRFAPSCSFETMARLGKFARERNLPVQTHVSENVKEIAWVAELFPDAANYTDVYDKTGLLKHDTVLAHGVHLKSDELDLIRRTHAGISHCPYSNAAIASGIAPIKHYINLGIKVGLGSDMSGGSTTSILKNARLALFMSRLLSEREGGSLIPILSVANALYLATLGGARVVDLSDSIGNFEVGKQFDAQLIDITSADSPIDLFDFALPEDAKERVDNYINKWVYVGDDRNTTKVWVSGKLVHTKYK